MVVFVSSTKVLEEKLVEKSEVRVRTIAVNWTDGELMRLTASWVLILLVTCIEKVNR
jgi:hypothetical protein